LNTEWEQAIRDDDSERLAALIDDGADLDALDRYGQTGLMIAAMHGCDKAARLLIDHGAELDHTAKYRLSALMLAVINHHVEIVRMLVQAGADTTLRGGGAAGFYHKTAGDLAAHYGFDDLVEILHPGRSPADRSPE
jgi:hypothetical protein